jgi:lambda repressor-like predicted transcriptional regulator
MDTHELNSKVAEAVVTALKERGKTLTWLARQSGISYPSLKRLTLGQARVSTTVMGSIAHALDVPVETLLPDSMSEKSRPGK